jgi:hypothetical protein
MSFEFFIFLFRPRFNAASNKNKYQEYFLGGIGGWCIGLTILPPSCADFLEIWEPQTSWNPQGLSWLILGLLFKSSDTVY